VIISDFENINEGTDRIAEKCITESNSKIQLNTKINFIEKFNNQYKLKGSNGFEEIFDVVILAAPIESSNIEFEKLNIKLKPRNYIKVYVTHLTGDLNEKIFGLKKINTPYTVYNSSPKNNTDFVSIGYSGFLFYKIKR
jgi:pyruvate/2-oxoglutarate dehydrogenase complex dihydrolipoamide dehydrogenase (E3) component